MTGEAPERIVCATIAGRVQGVGFRAWTRREAERLGLRGWVRNRRGGTVEAVFAGASADVDAMLAACRRGPRAAEVDDIRTEEIEAAPADLGTGFEERPTA